MDPRLKPLLWALTALLVGLLAGLLLRPHSAAPAPATVDAAAVADAALLALRDEGRIVPYSARYVAVVTARDSKLGLTASKTLSLPGTVRYGLDLTRLRRSDLAWDAPTRTLTVTLPPLELSGPAVEPAEAREQAEGGLVMALSGAEKALDDANRKAAAVDLLRQARAPAALAAARTAAMRLIAHGFALPLRAAGVDASVAVRFVDPAGKEEAAFLDRPRRLENALSDRQAGP
ncbi:MAG TPA: DUF4230 domain-containing protein, partial [Allosphingosinicella sp.]|nr:DUF4230 domain-containing protein [Allosphingosinicella sp.]